MLPYAFICIWTIWYPIRLSLSQALGLLICISPGGSDCERQFVELKAPNCFLSSDFTQWSCHLDGACSWHTTPPSSCGPTLTQPPLGGAGLELAHPAKTGKRKCCVQKPGSQIKLCRVKWHPALFIERHSAVPTGIPSSATSPSPAEGDPCTTLSLLWQLQSFLPLREVNSSKLPNLLE